MSVFQGTRWALNVSGWTKCLEKSPLCKVWSLTLLVIIALYFLVFAGPYQPTRTSLNQPEEPKPTSFSEMYKKKYGSRSKVYTTTPESEPVTYPPRPTTTLKYSRFVPTVKPFTKPNFLRIRTTTPETTTTETTSTTSMSTSTELKIVPMYPEPSLDTSLFGGSSNTLEEEEGSPNNFEESYFDMSKVPDALSSVDSSSFELDSINFEDGESAMAQTDKSSQQTISSLHVNSPKSSKMPAVPIRKVLDIFQELRLSFGKQWHSAENS